MINEKINVLNIRNGFVLYLINPIKNVPAKRIAIKDPLMD